MKESILHVRTMTGLEGVLADELEALGAQGIRPQNRLVICSGDLRLLYKINLHCRTAIRVLRPLGIVRNRGSTEPMTLTVLSRRRFLGAGAFAVGTLAASAANAGTKGAKHKPAPRLAVPARPALGAVMRE